MKWHREGKAGVLAALAKLGIEAREDVDGVTPNGTKWKADVLFAIHERNIAIVLQRSYQHLREFRRRQERFAECGIECFWLFRDVPFVTFSNTTAPLSELPVSILNEGRVQSASVAEWLSAIVDGSFRFYDGLWAIALRAE